MTCLAGRVPIDPNGRSYYDTGFFCTLFGAQHPFCRFFDRLYQALAIAFEAAFGVAPGATLDTADLTKALFRHWINAAVEDAAGVYVLASDLCDLAPATEPAEITYGEIFDFIAGTNDTVLAKIYQWWLWQQAFNVCRCVPTPTAPTPGTAPPPPLPPNPAIPPNCAFSWNQAGYQKALAQLAEYEAYVNELAETFAAMLVRAGELGATEVVLDRTSTVSDDTWPCQSNSKKINWKAGFYLCDQTSRSLILINPDTNVGVAGEMIVSYFYRFLIDGVLNCSPLSNPAAPWSPPSPPPSSFCAVFPEFCTCFTVPYTLAIANGCVGSQPIPVPAKIYDLPTELCPTLPYTLAIANGCVGSQPIPVPAKIYDLPD